jgi:hypothetical protein
MLGDEEEIRQGGTEMQEMWQIWWGYKKVWIELLQAMLERNG